MATQTATYLQTSASVRIPDSAGGVGGRRNGFGALRVECGLGDLALMALEYMEASARASIKDPGRAVSAGGDHALARAVKGQVENLVMVPRQRADVLSAV